MKIKNKLLFLTIILSSVYTLGLVTITFLLVNTRFFMIEKGFALKDMERVVNEIRQEQDNLGSIAQNYAMAEDSWKFFSGPHSDYIHDVFSENTLDNQDISLLAFYDRQGTLLRALCHLDGKKSADCSVFPENLRDSSPINNTVKNKKGFLVINNTAFLAVASSVFPGNEGKTPRGTIILARAVDDRLVQKIRERTRVFVELLPGSFADRRDIGTTVQEFTMSVDLKPGKTDLTGFIEYFSDTDTSVFLMRTKTERTLYAQGLDFVTNILLFFVLISVLFVVAINSAFYRWISRPLSSIESTLNSFSFNLFGGDANNDSGCIENMYSRDDEIGRFADTIRQMNNRIRDAHFEVCKIKENLEKMIQARTEDLISSNSKLEMFKKILENTSEAVVISDVSGRIMDVNDAMMIMSGFTRDELLEQDFCSFSSIRQEDDFRDRIMDVIRKVGHWEGEVWDRRKDGSVFPKWQTINSITDDSGEVINYVGVSTDISILKEAEETLNHLAYYDPLTNLPNRMLFSDRLEHQIVCSKRTGSLFALLFIDLDRFKTVNDTMGHMTGDALLVSVACRVKESIRAADTLCRIGGDEFALILHELSEPAFAGQISSEIVKKMSMPFQIDGSDIYIGASIGISLYPKDGQDPETLLRKADAAMYLAKDGGKGMYCYASGEMERVNKSRLEIEMKMHKALERQEFCLYYQPQNYVPEAAPGSPAGVSGVEALIRWIPEPGVVISPGEFLPVAEETGFIAPLGDWVLYQGCCDAKKWLDMGKPVQVSINVSARQFENGRLKDHVSAVLASTGLPASLLKLEVTESGCMRNIESVSETMREIKAMGVSFAIDDFGTGYCSLQYLNKLPVDCLKVDQSFIRSMNYGHSGGDIVSAIISMARAFGLKSVAEGVETAEQLDMLRTRGCDTIQGYYVARPMAYDDFVTYLHK